MYFLSCFRKIIINECESHIENVHTEKPYPYLYISDHREAPYNAQKTEKLNTPPPSIIYDLQ